MKSQEKLASFTAYCMEHPELRFWQALVAWSGYITIYGQNKDMQQDTFYIE